jgi:multiple sugar transport system permease protein
MASVLIMDTWQWTPFVAVVLLAGLAAIPRQVYEASSVDGSSSSETLWRVTLPLLKPMFALVVLLRIIFIFKIFDPVQILTGGGPGIATETLSVLTYIMGFKNFDVGMSSAIAVIQLVIITIIAKVFIGTIMKPKEAK